MKRGILIGVIAMATVVVASNILVQFLFGNWLTWGAFTYPIAFLVTDLMNRVYGPAQARKVIFAGFIVGVIASLVGKYLMSDRLSFSGKAWYHSGAPHSPIVGGIPDPDNEGGFLPVYGEVNSERLPSYFRLDLRADWELKKWDDAKVYFEIQNATNHQLVACINAFRHIMIIVD